MSKDAVLSGWCIDDFNSQSFCLSSQNYGDCPDTKLQKLSSQMMCLVAKFEKQCTIIHPFCWYSNKLLILFEKYQHFLRISSFYILLIARLWHIWCWTHIKKIGEKLNKTSVLLMYLVPCPSAFFLSIYESPTIRQGYNAQYKCHHHYSVRKFRKSYALEYETKKSNGERHQGVAA